MPRITGAVAAVLLALPAAHAGAQGVIDVNELEEIEDVDVMNADGEEIGEIEEVLIDGSGQIVAVTVEIGGFLEIGDEELVMALDDLTWREDGFVVDLTPDEMQSLPRFD